MVIPPLDSIPIHVSVTPPVNFSDDRVAKKFNEENASSIVGMAENTMRHIVPTKGLKDIKAPKKIDKGTIKYEPAKAMNPKNSKSVTIGREATFLEEDGKAKSGVKLHQRTNDNKHIEIKLYLTDTTGKSWSAAEYLSTATDEASFKRCLLDLVKAYKDAVSRLGYADIALLLATRKAKLEGAVHEKTGKEDFYREGKTPGDEKVKATDEQAEEIAVSFLKHDLKVRGGISLGEMPKLEWRDDGSGRWARKWKLGERIRNQQSATGTPDRK